MAPLASLKEQEKYMINATKDEYLVAEELLDSAINLFFEQKAIKFEPSENLEALKQAIKNCEIPDNLTPQQLVHEFEPWVEVRKKSCLYVQELGFNLEEYENNEL